MKRKIIASLVLLCMVVMVVTNSVFAAPAANFPSSDGYYVNWRVSGTVGNTWQTVVVVIQVIAVATVVFAGLRYMFASAERRADIKKGLTYLAIGAVFVFAASTIAKFVVKAGEHIII